MQNTKKRGLARQGVDLPKGLLIAAGVVGTLAPAAILALALSADGTGVLVLGAFSAGGVFLAVYVCLWMKLTARTNAPDDIVSLPLNDGLTADIAEKLAAIDEANQFFGTALNAADMFRLVSSRVLEIYPSNSIVLFVFNEDRDKLQAAFADGRNAPIFSGVELDARDGLAGLAAETGKIESDPELMLETFSLPAEALAGSRSAVAVPLFHDGEVFGVYQFYSDTPFDETPAQLEVLTAIGERVAPLFQSSIAFERSIASALTDVLTGLPNERAFYMVLENQLAESMRYRDERPLTILSIDIKGFAAVNSELGHQTGDRILKFTGERIKEQLRKMDFLARTANDEFAVILPTASEKVAFEIIERIKAVFAQIPFAFSEDEETKIWLNFGWASFWKDGETANQLIRNAQLRKQQEKAEEPAGLLWFPREYVN